VVRAGRADATAACRSSASASGTGFVFFGARSRRLLLAVLRPARSPNSSLPRGTALPLASMSASDTSAAVGASSGRGRETPEGRRFFRAGSGVGVAAPSASPLLRLTSGDADAAAAKYAGSTAGEPARELVGDDSGLERAHERAAATRAAARRGDTAPQAAVEEPGLGGDATWVANHVEIGDGERARAAGEDTGDGGASGPDFDASAGLDGVAGGTRPSVSVTGSTGREGAGAGTSVSVGTPVRRQALVAEASLAHRLSVRRRARNRTAAAMMASDRDYARQVVQLVSRR
jgi:hypothetical protein